MDRHVETELVFPLKILVLTLVFLKDPAEDLATAVLLMVALPTVVTVLLLETTTAMVPPLALMETYQTKPRRRPINPTKRVGQKETVDDLVLILIMVEEMVHQPVPL
jgi:hypothetical protein